MRLRSYNGMRKRCTSPRLHSSARARSSKRSSSSRSAAGTSVAARPHAVFVSPGQLFRKGSPAQRWLLSATEELFGSGVFDVSSSVAIKKGSLQRIGVRLEQMKEEEESGEEERESDDEEEEEESEEESGSGSASSEETSGDDSAEEESESKRQKR